MKILKKSTKPLEVKSTTWEELLQSMGIAIHNHIVQMNDNKYKKAYELIRELIVYLLTFEKENTKYDN